MSAGAGWGLLLLLGALHGINPGMGWLFAVALGLQNRSGRAVWRALLPLALGHAVAIGVVVAVGVVAGRVLPLGAVKIGVAAILVGFGLLRLVRRGHPRYGGMQVGLASLALWSFLMATAHGAGFMLLPVLLGMEAGGHGGHAGHAATADPWMGLAAVVVHSAAYLLVTGLVAWVVYARLGLALLRRAWLNLDYLWAAALVATGLLVLLV